MKAGNDGVFGLFSGWNLPMIPQSFNDGVLLLVTDPLLSLYWITGGWRKVTKDHGLCSTQRSRETCESIPECYEYHDEIRAAMGSDFRYGRNRG